jgi:hypothetical protein
MTDVIIDLDKLPFTKLMALIDVLLEAGESEDAQKALHCFMQRLVDKGILIDERDAKGQIIKWHPGPARDGFDVQRLIEALSGKPQ